VHHLLDILEEFEKQLSPLDYFLSRYFKDHKAIGAKDRAEIADTVYAMIRWKGLLDYIVEPPVTWQKRFAAYCHESWESHKNDLKLPAHIRLSFPEFLFKRLLNDYGIDQATELCQTCNTRALTTVRVNTLKISREELFARWKDIYEMELCSRSKYGIRFL